MSINVTVNGNPVCVRRSRMILSDMEQIKKNERDRRRRLRLEQVRQQSKEISCKLLERAKILAKKELTKLERNGKSELRKMHDKKIMEIQRKYEEDMEDIGLAHCAAALQPDVDVIIEVENCNNRALAVERGKEAMHRLKQSTQKDDPLTIQQERLRQVREVENIRSSMVAKLPCKTHSSKDTEGDSEYSQTGETIVDTSAKSSSKKKKHRKLIGKKSPTKVVSKSNIKIVGHQQKSKSPRHIVVDVHRANNSKSPKKTISRGRKVNSAVTEDSTTSNNVCKTASVATEVDCTNSRCDRDMDDQEPRKTVPMIKLTPTKADKVARYNPEDYKQKTSDSNSSSSSSVSDDSSYFSDGCGEFALPKTTLTTLKHHNSLASCKVQVYDHSTRQRNTYNQPLGLVERINLRSEPNAMDAAREIIEAENLAASLQESRRLAAERRGNDALLRERVRRDYDAMMKNFDNMTRDERPPKPIEYCTNQHMVESQRRECPEKTKFKNILQDHSQTGTSRADIGERIVTISSRDEDERTNVRRESTWQENPNVERSRCCDRHDNAEEMSREEHILEALKKVERQKRLLLREFGADLPNPIFSASMTPLFDSSPITAKEPTSAPATIKKRASPEIKIVNMSSSDENAKKTRTVKKKPKKRSKTPPPRLKTTETAVQTSRMGDICEAKDKSVQVEIIAEDCRATLLNETTTSQPLQYVEPRVTVITPQINDSSSESSNSRLPGIVIELENQQIKVTPRKKSSSEQSSKKGSGRSRSKPRSLPSSNSTSPVKRSATSAPSSRSGSPKKIDEPATKRLRSPDKTVDIRINRGNVKVQAGPSRLPQIAHESSIESSLAHSTPEPQEISSGKPYRIFKHPTYKRIHDIKDTSDTSTSYASLPAPTPGSMQSTRQQITPILEMLDSSANESVRVSGMNISPVSTPATPSPRTMNVPSNIPHPQSIGRILRYESTTIAGDDSTMPSSSQQENSSSTDPSIFQTRDRRSVADSHTATSRRSGKSSDYCSCSNPTCELLHENINDIRDYARRNHPEVLEKYDDLQNVCTERIASLTALIKRVRNEQQGMEFSMINPADETSLMQIAPSRPLRSDFQSVQRLVESIEAIHSKLAKTLAESQKIITNGTVRQSQMSEIPEIPGSSPSYETKSKGSASTSTEEPQIGTTSKSKPKVIAIEPIQVDLDRLKRGREPYTTMIVTTENPPGPLSGTPRHHEEIVAKLYQEILEQSKTVNTARDIDSGECGGSSSRRRTPSPPQNLPAARRQASPRRNDESEVTRDERLSSQAKKDEEFVPLLAGIPKIPRALPSGQSGTRPRPPPASGPYRSEINSPRHELSTIVEFDTPDTVNRSQGSAKTPTGKSRRLLQLQSPVKSSSSPHSTGEKNAKTQTHPVKPSVQAPPLISENMTRTIPRRLTMRDVASPDEKLVFQSDNELAISEGGTMKSLLSQGPSTSINGGASRRENDGKMSVWLTNGIAEREQRDDRSKGESFDIEEKLALIMSTLNTDSGVGNENKNEKLTSTSSTSFSGLSGISEIVSTPTSELAKLASSSEEIETALKKMGLGWAIVTLKKTREASALSSSSNSDLTPMNTARRAKSPGKKQGTDGNMCGLPDFSDVSSISIKEASKSTERAVLMKARTSTPNIQNSNSTSEKSTSATTSSSGISIQDPSDSLTAPNLSLTNKR